ncbi:MAG: V-type ATP synthase subunit B [Candidatus Woesearchaeota archaeon]
MIKEYKSVTGVKGPLIIVENVTDVAYDEIVRIRLQSGELRTGRVLEIDKGKAVVQVFEGTDGVGTEQTRVRFLGDSLKISVSEKMLGKVFDGAGRPKDNHVKITSDRKLDVNGSAINPIRRSYPTDFIQTGVASLDVMNTLVRGQKLPIFSGSGLSHNKLAAQIARQARVKNKNEKFAVVFAAMGITNEEALFFKNELMGSGSASNVAMFVNTASDPTIEQILTPRLALTLAEYLAFEKGMHVLAILTDMTNYCNALSQISAARSEIPGRRGFPGYMYTDLSTIYERAGRIQGRDGSITQLPIVSMPDDDITHPIPDLTGYITEGQFVFSRDLAHKNIYPPVDPLPSLSRLMKHGIGESKTREDHRQVSDQLYAAYSKGREIRDLVAVVGEESIEDIDKTYLGFAQEFENEFLNQSSTDNFTIEKSLSKAWQVLSKLPSSELKRLDDKFLAKYRKRKDD